MQVIKKRFRKDRFFLIIMIFVFIVILVFSLTKIKTWLKDRNNNNEVIDKITEEVKIDEIKDDDNTELINSDKEEKTSDYWYYVNFPLINVDFNNLKKINDETVGWINVNNTIHFLFVLKGLKLLGIFRYNFRYTNLEKDIIILTNLMKFFILSLVLSKL